MVDNATGRFNDSAQDLERLCNASTRASDATHLATGLVHHSQCHSVEVADPLRGDERAITDHDIKPIPVIDDGPYDSSDNWGHHIGTELHRQTSEKRPRGGQLLSTSSVQSTRWMGLRARSV